MLSIYLFPMRYTCSLFSLIIIKGEDTLLVSVYSHYWFINQTGLRLLYRTEENIDDEIGEPTEEDIPEKLISGQDDILEYLWYDMALDPHEWYQHKEEEMIAMSKPLLFSPYRYKLHIFQLTRKVLII